MMKSIYSFLRDFLVKGSLLCVDLCDSFMGLSRQVDNGVWSCVKNYLKQVSSKSNLDHSLFIKRQGSNMVVILIYVDDMLITWNRMTLTEHTKDSLHKVFKIKDIGELKFFFVWNLTGLEKKF